MTICREFWALKKMLSHAKFSKVDMYTWHGRKEWQCNVQNDLPYFLYLFLVIQMYFYTWNEQTCFLTDKSSSLHNVMLLSKVTTATLCSAGQYNACMMFWSSSSLSLARPIISFLTYTHLDFSIFQTRNVPK